MAKYVCPHCKQNDSITETVRAYINYTGEFNEYGEIDTSGSEDGYSTDAMETVGYQCHSCDKTFLEPLELDDEEVEEEVASGSTSS